MKTNVYVDGFNFYYGMFKGKRRLPWKWLDLRLLSQRLMPDREIHRIRYFTAEVTPLPHDPDQAIRQQTYLRALETLPNCTIHRGTFLTTKKRQRPVHPLPFPPMKVPIAPHAVAEVRRTLDSIRSLDVLNTEEKGSDVNLASFLLLDAFDHDCDGAIIISNDSDLATPIEMVKTRFGLDVTVFNPHLGEPTFLLKLASTRYRQLRPGVLRHCLFPDVVYDAAGNAIRKPQRWAEAEQRYIAQGGR